MIVHFGEDWDQLTCWFLLGWRNDHNLEDYALEVSDDCWLVFSEEPGDFDGVHFPVAADNYLFEYFVKGWSYL